MTSDLSILPFRIRSKFEENPESGCWEWTSAITGNGYGVLSWNGEQVQAHRLVYELIIEPITVGLTLDHLCRNRRCVNPEHVDPVSNRVNILRGESPSAQNARKTHCLRGHLLANGNLVARKGAKRTCLECHRLSSQKNYLKDPERRRASALASYYRCKDKARRIDSTYRIGIPADAVQGVSA